MDDIIKTLVMVAIVIFSLVSQINKRKKEGSARKPSAHSPNMENREKRRNKEEMEIPEEEGEEEKQRKQEKIIQQEKMNRYQPLSSQPTSPKAREKTDRTSSEKKDRTTASDPELTIHSAEEARRAIIWSEILNRKY